MKNPLVEALRNSSGRTAEEPPDSASGSPAAQDDRPDVGPKRILLDEAAAGTDQFSLLEPPADLVSGEPTNDPEADGEFTETIAEAEHPEAGHSGAVPRPSAAMLARIAVKESRFSIARAGRLSPLVCILLGAASSGGYLMYHEAGGSTRNVGLAALPDKIGSYGTGSEERVPEPQGPLQRFPLIESGKRNGVPDNMPVPSLRGGEQESTSGGDADAGEPTVAELAPPSGNEEQR